MAFFMSAMFFSVLTMSSTTCYQRNSLLSWYLEKTASTISIDLQLLHCVNSEQANKLWLAILIDDSADEELIIHWLKNEG